MAGWISGDAGAHSSADFGAEGEHAVHLDAGFETARGVSFAAEATAAEECGSNAFVERDADGSITELLAAAVL